MFRVIMKLFHDYADFFQPEFRVLIEPRKRASSRGNDFSKTHDIVIRTALSWNYIRLPLVRQQSRAILKAVPAPSRCFFQQKKVEIQGFTNRDF